MFYTCIRWYFRQILQNSNGNTYHDMVCVKQQRNVDFQAKMRERVFQKAWQILRLK